MSHSGPWAARWACRLALPFAFFSGAAHAQQDASGDAQAERFEAELAAYRHQSDNARMLVETGNAAARCEREPEPDVRSARTCARLLRVHGLVLAAAFRHGEADAAFVRASAWLEAAPVADERLRAQVDLARGVGLRNLRRDFPAAMHWLARGLKPARALPPLETAQGALWLASAQSYAGDRIAAGESFDRAEAALAHAGLPQHPLHAELATQRAAWLTDEGQPNAALAQLDRAVEQAGTAQPYSPSVHFIALYSRGQTEQRLNNLDAAMQWFERAGALPGAAAINGGYSQAMLEYSICGNRLRRGGDFASAQRVCAKAAAGFEALPQIPPIEAASAFNNLGNAWQGLEREDEAMAAFERSLDYAAQAGPATRAIASTAQTNLAAIHLHRGDFARAETLASDQARMLRPAGDFAPRTARIALALLAAAQWAQGRRDEAFVHAAEAERSAARARRVLALELDERRALAGLDAIEGGLPLMLGIALESGDGTRAEQAWDAALDAHGVQSIWAARRLATARARADPALGAIWRQWQDTRQTLARQRLQAARGANEDAAMRHAEAAFEQAELALARTTAQAGARLADARQKLTAVRVALPPGAALVRFVAADVSHGDAVPRTARRPHLLALLAERNGPVRLIDLGERDAIAAEVSRWYALASRPDADARARTLAAQALWRRIWKPLALHGERVFVLPDPVLDSVAFVALQDDAGHYLIESGLRVHRLEHERQLLATPAPSHGTGAMLLAGAPEFAGSAALAGCIDEGAPGLAALGGAQRELMRIEALAREAGQAPQVLRGRAATERAVRAAMPGRRFLHFATHGIVFGSGCESKAGTRAVALASASGEPAGTGHFAGLAALAWSGLDPQAQSDDDGLLTSDEIAALDLSGVEWAVLSGCETALGPALGREGIGGLRRAFALAGVRSVAMSLWRIDDDATAPFMERLYRLRLSQGQGIDAALHAAMREELAARRVQGQSDAPYWWAAFVASGDWR